MLVVDPGVLELLPHLRGFVRRRLADPEVAEDVVQNILLSLHRARHTYRAERPFGPWLHAVARHAVVDHALSRVGHQYDLKNIVDLARYLVQTPPVPVRWRRRMLALGSGDPTRAICSSLIAQAFQSVRYPILPEVTTAQAIR